MSDEGPFHGVPNEVLFALYDRLDYPDQLRLMAVDKRFRRLAREHRFYWQDLRLGTNPRRVPEFASVQLFLARLSKAGSRPFDVDITMPNPVSVIAKIATHLSHVRSLALRAATEHGRAILDLLQKPAPLLTSLSLKFRPLSKTERSLPSLDKDIFASHAPQLRLVTLLNVIIPSPVPGLFSHIDVFDIGCEYGSLRLPLVLRDGGIRRLALGRNVTLAAPEYGASQTWRHVQELNLDGRTRADAYPFAAWNAIPVLRLDFPDRTSTVAVLNHLPVNIHVAFRRIYQDSFVADVTAAGTVAASSIRRRLRGGLPGQMDVRDCESLQALRLSAARIVYLDIPITAWDTPLVQSLRLPELARLTLLFPTPSDARSIQWVTSRVSCPKLRGLVLRGRTDVRVDVTDVASFAQHLLCHVSFPIALAIEHLTMIDSFALWHGMFVPVVH